MSEVAVEDVLPVAVIGAGPQGLAEAAHLVERSVPVVVLVGSTLIGSSFVSRIPREMADPYIRVGSPLRLDVRRRRPIARAIILPCWG